MIEVLAGIMDDELLANQNNFSKSIKNEVKNKKEGAAVIIMSYVK